MASKSNSPTQIWAHRVLQELTTLYPVTSTALHWETPFQLLIATILSAQCTDKRVNLVTPGLFSRWPTAQKMAQARQEDLEKAIHSTGFYRNKAKNILGAAQKLVQDHKGQVPDQMLELTALPGVARKTANCVLGTAFGKEEGVVVDTHVGRLARRLGLTVEKNPIKVERDLMKLFPRSSWTRLSHLFIDHGRSTCTSRKAKCEECILREGCPKLLT
ncbi:MAG: endonuclease III [Planctomycetota bacterium]|nr:endonuclease III [Planctomycetota bacterium]